MLKYFDYPAWHPGGTWIAADHGDSVDTNGDGQNDVYFGGIWLVHAETGRTQPLVQGFGNPAWSPDGSHLAMEAGGHIFTIGVTGLEPASVDTSTLLQLTFDGRNFFPDWSPDGKHIVYDSDLEDTKYDIWIMDADGKNKMNISHESDSPEQGGWRTPNWSPDGMWIVHERYIAGGEEGTDVAVMDTAGTNSKILLHGSQPRYSPDGLSIGYYAQSPIGPPCVWVMNEHGSYSKKLSPEYSYSFDWSPNGKKVVFLYWDFLTDHEGNGELWVISVDGSGLRQITHFRP